MLLHSVDRPLLSLNAYSYPWSQAAAIAKIFDSASIPNVLWGDHILQYYGANQVILVGLPPIILRTSVLIRLFL